MRPAPPVAKLRPSTKLARAEALTLCAELEAQGHSVIGMPITRPEYRDAIVIWVPNGRGPMLVATVYAVSDEERA